MNQPFARPKVTLGIRAWVLIATLLAVLPLLAFSSWIVYALIQSQNADAETALRQRSQSLALTVKRRLDRAAFALEALAVSPAALHRDFQSLYDQARRMMQSHPDAAAIGLVRSDGMQIFATISPYGLRLPAAAALPYQRELFQHGATVYSPLFNGSLTGRRMMSVSVPVRIDGRVEYALQMLLPTESLSAVLKDQVLPAEWTAAVIDPRHIIAGRSGDAGKLIGQPVSDSLRDALEAGLPCPFITRTYAGVELSSCAVKVPDSDWAIAIGVPTQAFEHGLRDSLLKLLAAGLASIALGTAGAFLIANLIRQQVKMLATAALPAADVDDPTHLRTHASPIREIASVGEGLRHARRREDELASQLTYARHDSLTGLAGRELFRELVEKDRADAHPRSEHIALLFIDLDGFKAINDRLGHDAGDELLRSVALAIRRVIRASDIASRLGGDEFVVYLRGPASDLPAICAYVAQRLIARVAQLCDGLGCSIGVAIGGAGSPPTAELLNSADLLMLQAKADGKGRYVIEASDEAS